MGASALQMYYILVVMMAFWGEYAEEFVHIYVYIYKFTYIYIYTYTLYYAGFCGWTTDGEKKITSKKLFLVVIQARRHDRAPWRQKQDLRSILRNAGWFTGVP